MTRIERIADLLMGAAYADRELDGRELEAVKRILLEVTRTSSLSPVLLRRMERFRPTKFNVVETCTALKVRTTEERRHLLELVAAVQEADELWDLDEDAYLHRVAKAIGADDEVLRGLTVGELQVESVRDVLLQSHLDG